MKANELRILNLILYRGLPNYVCSIQSPMPSRQKRFDGKFIIEINPPDTFNVAIDEIEPIPLTEEWLLKFGFELNEAASLGSVLFMFFNDWAHFQVFKENDEYNWYFDGRDDTEVQYVHQLQNLYFALTGEELTLKS